MLVRTVLITGANRGIGLALAMRYAAEPFAKVIAAVRDMDGATAVHALVERSGGRVRLVHADLSKLSSLERLNEDAGDGKIDLLINNAGISGRGEFGMISANDLAEVFQINTFAPLLVTQALHGRLEPGAKVVNITSILGSMDGGGSRADALTYSMSKAALNMFSVRLATALRPRGIAVLALHPGGVQTRLGGSGAPLTADEAAASMIRVIEDLNMDRSGSFLAYDGSEIAW